MVKAVMPAATRTAPEMISIFFSFMGRTVSPPLPTSYVERLDCGSRLFTVVPQKPCYQRPLSAGR